MTRTEKKQLKESTEQLIMLRRYCSEMRSQVHGNLKTAMRCGFSYIDLDTLDDISITISKNKKLLEAA